MAARTASSAFPGLALLAALSAAVACAPAPPPAAEKSPDLETVEVTAAPDAAYSTADDRVERRADPGALAGALPDGFPPDIPVYRPSSLVDFTARPEGGFAVAFASPSEVSTVASEMSRKLGAAGWQAAKAGVWTKAGRKLRLTVEANPAGALFRLEF
jgi:hypothetical protein